MRPFVDYEYKIEMGISRPHKNNLHIHRVLSVEKVEEGLIFCTRLLSPMIAIQAPSWYQWLDEDAVYKPNTLRLHKP